MPDVLRTTARATPARMTAMRRRAGVLPAGDVVGVEMQGNPALNSEVTHLALTYSPAASPGAPAQLLLKRSQASEWGTKAAVWDQTNGSGRDYWWPKLRCLTGAFVDLRCADLLAYCPSQKS